MDRVEQLLEQYAAAVRSGDSDPMPFLDQLEGSDRERLERRMELFHMASPPEGLELPREWDPAAYGNSLASQIVSEIVEESRCPSGEWPELLPKLMAEQELEREVVVQRLAAGIGADRPDQVEKVGEYFHDMTWGTLDARRVTDTVLDRLAEILDTSREVLRRAGDALGGRRSDEPEGVVFARRPSVESLNFPMGAHPSDSGTREAATGPDVVDLLFTSRAPNPDRD